MTKMQTKAVPFTFTCNGYYYFSRRVPSDLMDHYSYPRIVQGLKTRSAQTAKTAKTRALVEAAKLDAYWSQLRIATGEPLGKRLLRVVSDAPGNTMTKTPSMVAATEAVSAATGPTLAECRVNSCPSRRSDTALSQPKSKTFGRVCAKSVTTGHGGQPPTVVYFKTVETDQQVQALA